jgi:LysM repeat protein
MRTFLLAVYLLSSVVIASAQTGKPVKHTVTSKETLYSLSRQYGVKVNDIIAANPGVTMDSGIKIGQVLTIPAGTTTAVTGTPVTTPAQPVAAKPTPAPAAVQPATKPVNTTAGSRPVDLSNSMPQAIVGYDGKYKYHTIQKQETLYGVSKRYGVSVQKLSEWNKLNGNAIKEGQMIIVGEADAAALYQKPEASTLNADNRAINSPLPKAPVAVNESPSPDAPNYEGGAAQQAREEIPSDNRIPIAPAAQKPAETVQSAGRPLTTAEAASAPPVRNVYKTSSSNPAEYPKVFDLYGTEGLKLEKKRGAAVYLADNTSGNANLAFYDNAEVGTVLKVTNMMNSKVVYVKVVGKVPTSDSVRDVVIKLTKQAAEQLGAIDEKFLVEVASYSAD